LNRLSSDERPPAVTREGPEPEAVLIFGREAVGLEGGLEATGGALVPRVDDCVKVGARGLVNGFGNTAERRLEVFVAVRDGWSGLAGPTAGNLRG
jgi:hypothetical protein